MSENLVVEDNVSPKVDSLTDFVPIRSIGTISQSLWNYTEIYRKKDVEMDINFEDISLENSEEIQEEKPVVKGKKMGARGIVSIYLMTVSAAIATASIIILGVMITR